MRAAQEKLSNYKPKPLTQSDKKLITTASLLINLLVSR